MTWLQTANGHAVDLINPAPEQIVLTDIAFALSHLNRYTGHVGRYSVAEHSVRVAWALRAEGYDTGTQRAGLMHDAHEAFTGDVASPIKRVLGPEWETFEKRMEAVVRRRFRIPLETPKSVKEADLRMLLTERAALMGDRQVRPWNVPGNPYPAGFGPSAGFVWSPQYAQDTFLEHCARLDVL